MDLSSKVASDVTVYGKYAKYVPEIKRRESWQQIVARYEDMMVKKYPSEAEVIYEACDAIRRKEILPSMRGLQFAGTPIERNNSRIYNCAFMQASYAGFFRETMFLLLGGTGVGYSVQDRHVSQLPAITSPGREKRFNVQDSIEGWADAVDAMFRAYFKGKNLPRFDFSDVRPKGMRLITAGGKAPGPGPLRVCLDKIRGLLETKSEGSQLTSVEVSDLACIIADAVLSGGIRRAAMICLTDIDDAHMLAYKRGAWWEMHPERARVNVSAVAFRHHVSEQIDPTDSVDLDSWHNVIAEATTKEQFDAFWKATEESKSGEPGIYWSNHPDWGTNPCCEIGLRHKQFCNLTTINFATCRTQEDLNRRAELATVLGTLQAGFTDMHYLGREWEENCRKDSLLGVSLTGIGDNAGYEYFDFEEAAQTVKRVNAELAQRIGIQAAARTTCIKPEGTASLVLGCASGVHGRHSDFYIRRFRFKRNESVAQYFAQQIPDLVVEDKSDPDGIILELPQKSPQSSISRTEAALETLKRLKFFRQGWVEPGHSDGENTHNVSCTVSVRDDEWGRVGDWMWSNRDFYNGIAVLPWDGGSYSQAPFEDCDEETYNRMMEKVKDVDLSKVYEEDDNTTQVDNIACGGGACSL
jgi:ribonucleoside-triphosphate reductase